MEDYNDFVDHLQKIADINASAAVLHWDKEVNMPPEGNRFRAQQLATLSGLSHNHFVQDEFGDLLNKLGERDDLDGKQSANISRIREDYDKATRLDEAFVVKRSRAISACHVAWMHARRENDSTEFLEKLAPLVQIKREEAERLGYEDHPYDALLDQYETDLDTATCERIFGEIKEKLLPLLEDIRDKMPEERPEWLNHEVNVETQLNYGKELCGELGYDFDCGRQDLSEHPFTISFSPEDVRITTRIDSRDFSNMLWSTIHELGHALYEQGLPAGEYGLPSGQPASLAIHESQARLWENQVGRSRSFWNPRYEDLKKAYFPSIDDLTLESFMKGINHISPGSIRTESDELHYHLHILIRYEIEKALMSADIEVDDLPELWREKYRHYLGVEVPDAKRGILQDIHWSHGSIGYFPTYSLGSLYAAQFYATALEEKEISESLWEGKTDALLEWLRNNIHARGRRQYPEVLCREITGESLRLGPFLQYAREKYDSIF